MSQKRQQQQEDRSKFRSSSSSDASNDSDEKRRKFPSLRNVVLEVMSMRKAQHYMEPILEPLIRRVVREEVDLALRKYMNNLKRNSGKEMPPSDARSLQLIFLSAISLPVFTGTRIEGEDCTTLKVALLDALTRQVVTRGLESSAKVEILVLEGDFDGDEGGNWTPEEFKNNIVREREGKKPLLNGDAFLNLAEGIGLVGEISFTDNSSWTRSRKFRLGARVVDNCDGIRVREAKTESFIVRDHRGELYKKHHPPSLTDEVWRLEKIGKGGAFHKRLSREKVKTVKDFLILLHLDPVALRNILGTGMSAKMWEVTMEHAKTCVLDKKLYLYCPGPQKTNGVVFNVVGQVVGLLSDSQYVLIDKLSDTEKADAHNLVISAFKQWEGVVPFDDVASFVDGHSHSSNILYPSNSPTRSSDGSKILSSQKIDRFDFSQLNAASPSIMSSSVFSIGGVSGLDDYGLHSIDPMDVTFDEPLSFPGQVSDSLMCDTDSIAREFCEDEHLQYFDNDCSLRNANLESQTDLHSAVSGFLFAPSPAVATEKAHRRWAMIFSVLRWFSIRRIVARKTHGTQSLRYY